MKSYLLSVVFFIALVVPNGILVAGSASDNSKDQTLAPAQGERFNWSGLYGGLNVGALFSHHDIDILFGRPFPDADNTGVIGGGQLGLNLQWGHFVVGVEGDFQGASDDSMTRFDSVDTTSPDPIDRASQSQRREMTSNWFASARGRVGFAWNRLFFYASGGAAFTSLDTKFRDIFRSATLNSDLTASDSQVQTGWTVGGGVEWAVSKNTSVGIEYRHADFGKDTFANPTPDRFHFSGFTQIDSTTDQAVAKINYRFWGFGRQ